MTSRRPKRPPDVCPACGADVPETALACPECGSDYETGWNEDAAVYDGLDLPDKDFDYDEYVKREFGDGAAGHSGARLVRRLLLIIAVVGLCLAVWWLLMR